MQAPESKHKVNLSIGLTIYTEVVPPPAPHPFTLTHFLRLLAGTIH